MSRAPGPTTRRRMRSLLPDFVSPAQSSLAVKLSPKLIRREEAVQLKRLNRGGGVALRIVDSHELSLQEVENQQLSGRDFLVSPKGSNSNVHFEDMKQIISSLNGIDMEELKMVMQGERRQSLYSNFVGGGWNVCEYDLITIVMDMLDYSINRAFKEDPEYYAQFLVPHPLSSLEGSNLSYTLLQTAVEDGQLTENQVLVSKELLSVTEAALLNVVHMRDDQSPEVRREASDFRASSTGRETRTFGAHVFSSMLKLRNKEYVELLPPVKPLAFNLERPLSLRFMALRALVLKDLQRRFECASLLEDTPILHQIGFHLVKRIMAAHAPYSFRVSYGNISAEVIKEGQKSEDIAIGHIYELRGVANAEGSGPDGVLVVANS